MKVDGTQITLEDCALAFEAIAKMLPHKTLVRTDSEGKREKLDARTAALADALETAYRIRCQINVWPAEVQQAEFYARVRDNERKNAN